MSAELVKVEGVKEFTAAVDKVLYGEADKVVKLAMTDAAKAAVKELKGALPKKMFRNLAKYKFKQGVSLKFMNVGLFDRHKTLPQVGYPDTKGNNKRIWHVAYWLNYGTLNRRDRTHQFAQRIKNKSINSKRGVRPQNFFDKNNEAMTGAYHAAFKEAFEKRTQNFYGKQNS